MKQLIILLICLLSSSLVFSQEAISKEDSPEKRAAYITDQMVEKLELDINLKDTFYALNLKYANIIQKEIIDQDLSLFSQYHKGMKINKKKEEELLPLLSEKQKELYQSLKKENSKKFLAKLFGF
ncbi:MAG: hypothetical protein MK226_19475 [Saprospiraceae bacterium]|nr:hypothetical protein [Saprospiraceae bacterium]